MLSIAEGVFSLFKNTFSEYIFKNKGNEEKGVDVKDIVL